MNVTEDSVLSALNAVVRSDSAAATIETTLQRVLQQLAASANVMAWEVIPLSALRQRLRRFARAPRFRIFVIRAGARTGQSDIRTATSGRSPDR